jgi:PAS domain S-box-containing protein
MWGLFGSLKGQRFDLTALAAHCCLLSESLQESLKHDTPAIQVKCKTVLETIVQVTIKPVWSNDTSLRTGTLIYMADVTPHERLHSTNEALRLTQAALEAANEELETANEQLRMTNEELESTNEELQTTNEELQSLNEELETTNDELSQRASGVEELNLHYREMLEQMPWPVFLLSEDLKVHLWNTAAQRLFGFSPRDGRELRLFEIPFSVELRQAIEHKHEAAIKAKRSTVIHEQLLASNGSSGFYDIHLKPLSGSSPRPGVLLMFEKTQSGMPKKATSKRIEGPVSASHKKK